MSAPTLSRILLVEDEPDIRAMSTMALTRVGKFDVQACGHGREVIPAARANRPDLVILDVMMPDIDGPTVLASLKAEADLADIPVIFMTAKVQPSEVERFMSLGAIGVVAKPYDPMTLSNTIRGIWEKARDAA